LAADDSSVDADARPAAVEVDSGVNRGGAEDLKDRVQTLVQVSVTTAGKHVNGVVAAVAAKQVTIGGVAKAEADALGSERLQTSGRTIDRLRQDDRAGDKGAGSGNDTRMGGVFPPGER